MNTSYRHAQPESDPDSSADGNAGDFRSPISCVQNHGMTGIQPFRIGQVARNAGLVMLAHHAGCLN